MSAGAVATRTFGLLVAGNAILLTANWHAATADWPPLPSATSMLTPGSAPMAVRPPRAVEHEASAALTRMFGAKATPHPAAPELEQPNADPENNATFQLIGVISNVQDDQKNIALIVCGPSGRLIRAHSGSRLLDSDWTVGRITAGTVELLSTKETHMLKLD